MDTAQTVLLHLSDIHFRKGVSGGTYDLDRDLRNELERDAERMVERVGVVRGILVTGDIAFAGQKEEYDEARDWLAVMCKKVGCPPDFIWTTPGNHDIDRSIIRNSRTLQVYRETLRACRPENIDHELDELLRDEIARKVLFLPLENYNKFALQFGCHVNADRPRWYQDLLLNDGSTLRLLGLNSVLISDERDDDKSNKLVLGTLQALAPNLEGIEYVTLCHHPLDWLLDSDKVHQSLSARVRIQLFGHKHVLRADRINDTVRLTAGAVHPDRRESGWKPRYNFITIAVSGEAAGRNLDVTVYPRVWSDEAQAFGGDYDHSGSDARSYSLPIRAWRRQSEVVTEAPEAITAEEDPSAQPAEVIAGAAAPLTIGDTVTQESPPMNKARRLTYRFLSLPYHDRLRVAQDLELLLDEDEGVEDTELFKRFFQRAKTRQLLARLWERVEAAHGDRSDDVNPFSGL